jgi:energy-coupling factor transport system substrate-specific component
VPLSGPTDRGEARLSRQLAAGRHEEGVAVEAASQDSGRSMPVGQMNTIDIVVVAAIGIVFGVLSALWQTVYIGAGSAFGPLGSAVVAGFVCIPAILSAYIVRKPGAALLSEVISVFGQALGGNPLGIVVLVYGIAQGLPAELTFAATRYRSWGWPTLLVAAALSQAGSWVASVWVYSFFQYDAILNAALLIGQMASGVVLAGVVSKLIGDALLRTGALNNFPIAREANP